MSESSSEGNRGGFNLRVSEDDAGETPTRVEGGETPTRVEGAARR